MVEGEAVQSNQGPGVVKLGASTGGPITLPCGYLDEKGTLHDVVHLREMKGHEEDILASKKIGGPEKITKIIANCVTKIGDIVERPIIEMVAAKLTITDRVYIMLMLRALSLGSNYDFDVTCPKCGASSSHKVNLDDLDVKSPADKKVRDYALKLPSNKQAVLKIMTAEDETRLERAGRDGDTLSLAIMARLKSLNGRSPALSEVKDLGLRDRCFIRDQYEKIEGSVDTDVDAMCPGCRFEFKTSIDVGQPSFFFPKTPGLQVSPLGV